VLSSVTEKRPFSLVFILMKPHKTAQLYDKQASIEFYEDRYAQGYMDEWPDEKKQRIFEVIQSLDLPERGDALDFGCGNGLLTGVIRQALPPAWTVYGTDISAIAIDNAQKYYPDCNFFVGGESSVTSKQFDFVFTHHVLEHVYDLDSVLNEIDKYLKPITAVLHILPCGNEESFEHNVSILRKDGINPDLENRFFYEDEGHVRRLSTDQLSKLYQERKFQLRQAYYSNHYYGAINWITQSGPWFVKTFTDPSQAINAESRSKLQKLRLQLFLMWFFRYPAAFIEIKLRKRNRSVLEHLLIVACLPFYLFAKPMDLYLKSKANDEWNQCKTKPNGSEMYLFFQR
jgi:SAM-dependent methyltransferase